MQTLAAAAKGRLKRNTGSTTAFSTGCLLCITGLSHAEQASDMSQTARLELEEVIVTAQKREERLQDVPSSMSVLSASNLEAQGATQLSSYAKQIPGLRVVGEGGPGKGKPVLRGISTGTDRSGVVGMYLDDVPFTPSSVRSLIPGYSFDPALADIERIEVLKGPQSTLYGANALSGLIKFVSKRPDLEDFDGSVRVDGSMVDEGGAGYGARASMNIPIVTDRIGARMAGFYRKDPGYVDNLFRGEEDVNTSTVTGGRISVLGKIGQNVETTFSALIQDNEIDAPYAVAVDPVTLQPVFGELAYSSQHDLPTTLKYRSVANVTVATLPFATLSNTLSYSDFKVDSSVDVSSLMVFFSPPAGTGAVAQGLGESERISDELRLTSNPAKLEWMLGLFYTEEDSKNRSSYRGTNSDGQILDSSSPFYNVYTFATDATYDEMAVFGNLTYNFTDKFEATVGARYSKNEQDYHTTTSGLFTFGRPLNIGFPTEDSANNYLFTVSYKPLDTLTMYVRAANAYRPGGANVLTQTQIDAGAPPQFESDTLWNYEAGMKGSLGSGAVNYSLAAFSMKWTDIQINTIISGFSVVGNVGEAQSDGIEASLGFSPVDGLYLGLSAAYIDAQIEEDAPSLGAREGDPLPYSPKFSGSALADYRVMLSNDMEATVGLTYAYYTEQRIGFGLAPIELPSYGTLDLRCGLDRDRWSVIARVENVTDKYALTYVEPWLGFFGGRYAGTVIRPRTYSLSLEARF